MFTERILNINFIFINSAFRTSSIHVPKSMFIAIFRCYVDIAVQTARHSIVGQITSKHRRCAAVSCAYAIIIIYYVRWETHGAVKKSHHEYDLSVIPTMRSPIRLAVTHALAWSPWDKHVPFTWFFQILHQRKNSHNRVKIRDKHKALIITYWKLSTCHQIVRFTRVTFFLRFTLTLCMIT